VAGSMGAYDYVSDDGGTYRIRLDDTNAAAVGAVAATTAVPKPGTIHPRYLLAQHPTTGRERRITCPNPANTLWVGDGTQQLISLRDYDTNLAVNFLVAGRIGERRFAS
jgi:hypothetical protein